MNRSKIWFHILSISLSKLNKSKFMNSWRKLKVSSITWFQLIRKKIKGNQTQTTVLYKMDTYLRGRPRGARLVLLGKRIKILNPSRSIASSRSYRGILETSRRKIKPISRHSVYENAESETANFKHFFKGFTHCKRIFVRSKGIISHILYYRILFIVVVKDIRC